MAKEKLEIVKTKESKKLIRNAMTADSGKRGRLVFLAIIISLSVFLLRAFNVWEVSNLGDLAIKVFSYGLFTLLALIWSFRFAINWRSLFVVIPQSVVVVMGFVLFIEMFFFRDFDRLSDFVYLFAVWGGGFLTLYVSFLMTNIFNVSMFKELPLKQVAKTTSYILSLIMVYLFSFSFLAMQLHFTITAVMLFIVYGIIIYTHFYHLNLSKKNLFNALVVVLVGMLASIISFMFIGTRHEIIALMPTAVAFSVIGITMHKTRTEGLSDVHQFEYIFVYIAILVLNILFS
jgi:hypothetical protein